MNMEKKLYNDVFLHDDYEWALRPAERAGEVVNVTLYISLYKLIKIDEKEEKMQLSVWLEQRWRDYRLAWNSSEYGGLQEINVPPHLIWKPDIVLYNDINEGMDSSQMNQGSNLAIVFANGDVSWSNLMVVSTRCGIDIKKFPYDTQNCYLCFTSWTHNINKLNLTGTQVDKEYFQHNPEWNLTGVATAYEENPYSTGVYAEVYFHLYFQRRSLFYVFHLIIPMVVITLLTTLVFVLPQQSGERMGFAVTLMLTATVFMLLVAESIPESSDSVPFVGIFFYFCFLLMFCMIVALCLTSGIYNYTRVDGPMGKLTRKYILEKLSCILSVRGKAQRNTNSSLGTDEIFENINGHVPSNDTYPSTVDMQTKTEENEKKPDVETQIRKRKIKNNEQEPTPEERKDRNGAHDSSMSFEEEWYIVGKTIDRGFFIFFVLVFIFGCIACFAGTRYVK